MLAPPRNSARQLQPAQKGRLIPRVKRADLTNLELNPAANQTVACRHVSPLLWDAKDVGRVFIVTLFVVERTDSPDVVLIRRVGSRQFELKKGLDMGAEACVAILQHGVHDSQRNSIS